MINISWLKACQTFCDLTFETELLFKRILLFIKHVYLLNINYNKPGTM